jgi:hypothetical protein
MPESKASPDPLREYLRRAIDIETEESNEYSYRNADIRASLQKSFYPVSPMEVDAFVAGSLGLSRALYLPQVWKRKKALPLLPVLSRIASPQDSNRLSILLFCTFSFKDVIWAYCFRFEEPELPGRPENRSMHGYHHIQLTIETGRLPASIRPVLKEIDPLVSMMTESHTAGALAAPEEVPSIFYPGSIPAFPLAATNKVELLICVLVSLYGWPQFYKQWVTNLSAFPTCNQSAERVRRSCGVTSPAP